MHTYTIDRPTDLERLFADSGLVQEASLETIYNIKGNTTVQRAWQDEHTVCRVPDPKNPADWEDKLLSGRRGEFFTWAMKGCQRVLDVGCGEGWPSLYLARTVPEVHGLDCSDVHIELARNTAGLMGLSNVTFHVGRIEALPFADESFDGVCFGGNVMTYRTLPSTLLSEIHRVLKPGRIFSLEQWPVDPGRQQWERIGFFIDSGQPILHIVAGAGLSSRTYFVEYKRHTPEAAALGELADLHDGNSLSQAQREGCLRLKEALEHDGLESVKRILFGGEDTSLAADELPSLCERAGFRNFCSWAVPSGRRFAESLQERNLLAKFTSSDIRPCLEALVRSAVSSQQWVHEWVTMQKDA